MASSLIPRRASRALTSFLGHDPFRALQKEMDELMDQFSHRWSGEGQAIEAATIPPIDISETDGEVKLTVDVPGMKAEEINVDVTGQRVQIRGEHKEEKEEKGRTYHRIERRSGSVYRSVELPCAVKEDKVSAEYKDGVLTVTMPKSEVAKTRKVEVKATAK